MLFLGYPVTRVHDLLYSHVSHNFFSLQEEVLCWSRIHKIACGFFLDDTFAIYPHTLSLIYIECLSNVADRLYSHMQLLSRTYLSVLCNSPRDMVIGNKRADAATSNFMRAVNNVFDGVATYSAHKLDLYFTQSCCTRSTTLYFCLHLHG